MVVESSFLLDIEDRTILARNFDQVADLLTSVPSIVLDYLRDFYALEHVRTAIIDYTLGTGLAA